MTHNTIPLALRIVTGLALLLVSIVTLHAQPQQNPNLCEYKITLHGNIECPGDDTNPMLTTMWSNGQPSYQSFWILWTGTIRPNIPYPCPPAASFVSGSFDGGATSFTLNQPRVKVAGPNGCCIWAWAVIDGGGYVHIHLEQCVW